MDLYIGVVLLVHPGILAPLSIPYRGYSDYTPMHEFAMIYVQRICLEHLIGKRLYESLSEKSKLS